MEITTYPKLNQPEKIMMISYVAAGLPPHNISIPTKQYSKEMEKKLIKNDINTRLKQKKETYVV